MFLATGKVEKFKEPIPWRQTGNGDEWQFRHANTRCPRFATLDRLNPNVLEPPDGSIRLRFGSETESGRRQGSDTGLDDKNRRPVGFFVHLSV